MNKNDNKKRPFCTLRLLQKYSDDEHSITTEALIQYLKEEYNITASDRKTIYSDIKVLSDLGYDIESERGYKIYPSDNPQSFSLAEVKILTDAILSFKNLGKEKSVALIEKLYSYISIYQQEFLDSLANNDINKKESDLSHNLATILYAIYAHKYLLMPDKDGEMVKIIPFLIDYKNNFYYLYYAYAGSNKNYHKRFDRIKKLVISEEKFEDIYAQNILECRKQIKESVSSFHSDQNEYIKLYYDDSSAYIKGALEDDFGTVVFNQHEGRACANFAVNISNDFFAKLAKYGNRIEVISPTNIIEDYQNYLQDILDIYHK